MASVGGARTATVVGVGLAALGCGQAPAVDERAREHLGTVEQAISAGSGFGSPYRYAPQKPSGGGQLGDSLHHLGDVNGDGFDDIAAGAPYWGNGPYEPLLGRIHILYGSKSGTPTVQYLDGTTLEWVTQLVRPAGDVNGDGHADVFIRQESNYTSHFRDALHLGGPTGISTTVSWALDGWNSKCVASAGDVTHDGRGDVLCLSPKYTNGAWHSELLLFAGTEAGLTEDPAWSYVSSPGEVYLDYATGIGDFNGDGFADVAGLAPCSGDESTSIVVFYGTAQGLSPGIGWVGNALCETRHLAAAGDLNGDGYADIVTSALEGGWDAGGGAGQGFFGAKFPATIPAWTARLPTKDVTRFGYSLAGLGDVHGDGLNDVVVGADYYFNELLGHMAASYGRAFLFNGTPNGPSTSAAWSAYEKIPFESYYAIELAPAGDFNGDGFADLAVSDSFGQLTDQGPEGMLYLYMGSGGGVAPTQGLIWKVVARGSASGTIVEDGARSDDASGFVVSAWGRGSYGNVPAKLEIETKPASVAFDGTGLLRSEDFLATGRDGVELDISVAELQPDQAYHSRLRLVYRQSAHTSVSHSRWVAGPSLTTACDATSPDLDEDGACDSTDDDDGARDDDDCAPRDAAVHAGVFDAPGDGVDQDCSGVDAGSCFEDLDHDGFGSETTVISVTGSCSITGMSDNKTDCDDEQAEVHPGTIEIADDGLDQDCDGKDMTTPDPAGGGGSGGGGASNAGMSGSAGTSAGSASGGSAGLGGIPAGDGGSAAAGSAATLAGSDSGGSSGSGGKNGGTSAGVAGRVQQDPSPLAGSGDDSGCSCSLPAERTARSWELMFGLLLALLRRRRTLPGNLAKVVRP